MHVITKKKKKSWAQCTEETKQGLMDGGGNMPDHNSIKVHREVYGSGSNRHVQPDANNAQMHQSSVLEIAA